MGSPRLELPIGVRLDYITTLLSAPCKDKWSLLVKTGLPALGEAVILLLTPDLDEIIQEYLHPKIGRRGGRFGVWGSRRGANRKAGRNYRVFGGGFPDVDQGIADKLPGRKYFGGRVVSGLEAWAWTGIDIADLIGWYWMLASLSDAGTITWASNIMHSVHCLANVSLSGSWKKTSCPSSGGVPWSSGVETYLHDEVNCTFGLNGRFAPTTPALLQGAVVNWLVLFEGQGFARFGPMTLKLWDGVSLVYEESVGSVETLDFFTEGNIQVSGSWSYGGFWTHGELGIIVGDGTGYRCDGFHSEGQLFGGTGPVL